MSSLLRPLAGAVALTAMLALVHSAQAQKPLDNPILERMRKDIFFLASPECEGRGIDTKGIEKAADYVAATFKAAGLKPAMKDGSYFQPFTVTMSAKLSKPTSLTIAGPNDAKKELKLNTDFTAMGFSPTSKADAGLVFVGYGITAPDLKYDDYAGQNVEGKFVVILRRTPRYNEKGDKRFDTTVPDGEDSTHAAFATKIELAQANKAAGVIMVNDAGAAGKTDALAPYPLHATGTTPATIPVVMVKRAVIDEVLAGGPWKSLTELETAIGGDLKPRSFAVANWTARAEVTVERTDLKVKNIVGVLEGSGPLKDETVVIGAHYDHVGYGSWGSLAKDGKGKIHYGADDNASGTTGLMELARRYGAAKNRQGRRLVFVAFTAEERGLYGSIHYCKEPLFPLDKTVAMINMDMIGRTQPVSADWLGLFGKKDRLVVYGTGTGTGLDKLVDQVSAKSDFRVSAQKAGTGPSDHDSFYRKKVPVLFLYTGTHGEYHRPTDVPERINIEGLKKTADFAQSLADDLTTRSTAPKFQAVSDPWRDPTEAPRGPQGPRLGVRPDYMYEGEGMRLEGVTPGGVAEKTGLKDGDIIVEVAGKPTPNVGAYMTAMSAQKIGTTIDIVVDRKGKKLTLKANLEE
ncbi:M28 family peptidase [Gemmata sp. JC717]|uniref:M28 family peptidase n=1 Tax=Gemmata algarum TaxID=2975278 RepID=UPI0021BB5568|nr:M28 family peptidase [Gemmata algarum]MDY3551247.1 M28 family peptidase [Gemmata algarum]